MILYPSGEEILIVGSSACGFEVQVGEPAQFEANVNRPATSAFNRDAFPTLWDKAAALLHSFATTQTLIDGNKRTAWAASWLLLRLNGAVGVLRGSVDADLAEELVLGVADGKKDVPEISDCLQRLAYPQLGKVGHLPDGFQLTTPLKEVGNALIGHGALPDGTPLIYQYMVMNDGTPTETVFTPDQAREFAENLLLVIKGEVKTSLSVPVSGFVAHLDLHHFPRSM